jgi:hypothetical protein
MISLPPDIQRLYESYLSPHDIFNLSCACKSIYRRLREANLHFRDLKIDLLKSVKAIDVEEILSTESVKEEFIEIYKEQFPYLHLICLIYCYGETIHRFKGGLDPKHLESLDETPLRKNIILVVIKYYRAYQTHPSLPEEFFDGYLKKFKITSFAHASEGYPPLPLTFFKSFCKHAKKSKEPIKCMAGWSLDEECHTHLTELLKVRKIEILDIQNC